MQLFRLYFYSVKTNIIIPNLPNFKYFTQPPNSKDFCILNRITLNLTKKKKESWMEVVHFDDIPSSNDPVGMGILHTDAVLGNVQHRSSAVKWSNFGEPQIFFEFSFLALAHLVS